MKRRLFFDLLCIVAALAAMARTARGGTAPASVYLLGVIVIAQAWQLALYRIGRRGARR